MKKRARRYLTTAAILPAVFLVALCLLWISRQTFLTGEANAPGLSTRDFVWQVLLMLFFVLMLTGVLVSVLVDRFTKGITAPYEQMLLYIETVLNDKDKAPPDLSGLEDMEPVIGYFHYLLGQISHHIQQITQKTEEIESIVGSMEEGLVMLDNDLNILLINRQAGKALAIPTNSWQKKITYLYRNEAFAQMLHHAQCSETRQIADIQEGKQTYRFYANPVPAGGYVLLISDVTELLHLENMRSEFAANVSHELKTPLTSISGFAELLQNGMVAEPDKITLYAGKILTESRRLVALIDDILNLSTLENATPEKGGPVELRGVVDYVLEVLTAQLTDKQIAARVEGNLWVRASYPHLYELAFNLCENGVKYNVQGGELLIRFLPDGFAVTDTGIGIAAEHLDQIFQRFYRVDKARGRKTGGTGLGLSIAKHVMALYGGSIGVTSGDKGTTFTVKFPADIVFNPQLADVRIEDQV